MVVFDIMAGKMKSETLRKLITFAIAFLLGGVLYLISADKGYLLIAFGGAFYGVISILWKYKRKASFWIGVAILAAIHGLIYYFGNFKKPASPILFYVITIGCVDGFLIFIVLSWFVKTFSNSKPELVKPTEL